MTRRRLALVAALLLAITAVACQPRLGSSTNGFGSQLAGDVDGDGYTDAGECINPQAACAGRQPVLWGAINSPSWGRNQGDPYSATCSDGMTCGWAPATLNPERRRDGYLYGIEVAEAGQAVTVELYDAPVNSTSSSTGDYGSFPVQYELFGDDGDDLTTDTDPTLSLAGACTDGPGRRGFPGGYDPAGARLKNRWWTLCTFTAPTAGVYPLRVTTADLDADPTTGLTACADCTTTAGALPGTGVVPGLNAFAIRSTADGGTAPRAFAIGDMSIHVPLSGGTTEIPLVEVPPERAGDRLTVDVFDPGDGTGTIRLGLVDSSGGVPSCVSAIGRTGAARTDLPESTTVLGSGCTLLTTNGGVRYFDGRWVRLVVDLPAEPACTTECWWHLQYLSTGASTDRLTVAVAFEDRP